jgi:hypothetical protein
MKLSDRNKGIMLNNYYEKAGCENLSAAVINFAYDNNSKGLRSEGVYN